MVLRGAELFTLIRTAWTQSINASRPAAPKRTKAMSIESWCCYDITFAALQSHTRMCSFENRFSKKSQDNKLATMNNGLD